MKDVCTQCTVIERHLQKNFQKQTELYRYTFEIYRSLQQSFSKKVKIWLLPFSVKFFQNEVFSLSVYKRTISVQFSVPNIKSTFYGTESFSYQRPKIQNLVPKELKELSSLSPFKKEIEKWKRQNCPSNKTEILTVIF